MAQDSEGEGTRRSGPEPFSLALPQFLPREVGGWVGAECSLRSAQLWKKIKAFTSDIQVPPVPQGKQRKEWSLRNPCCPEDSRPQVSQPTLKCFLFFLALLPHRLCELELPRTAGEGIHLKREQVGWGDGESFSEGFHPGSGKAIA